MMPGGAPQLNVMARTRTALLDCFTPDGLRILVADHFDVRLEWVTANRNFETVVYELIDWANREGHLPRLLAVAADRVPGRPVLAALRDEANGNGANVDAGADLKPFAIAFRERVDTFGYLTAYKSLHDILHKLEAELPAIEAEATAWWTAGTPVSKRTSQKLRKAAADAIKAAKDTDSADELKEWMAELAASVERFLAGGDAVATRRAFEDIQNVPSQKLAELNSGLVRCNKELSLAKLLALASPLVAALGRPGATDDSGELAELLTNFLTPAADVDGLTRNHNLCQRIDVQLRAGDAVGAKVADDVPLWTSVEKWLAELAEHCPGDDLFAEARQSCAAFRAGAGGLDPLLDTFAQFFLGVDGSLRDVTQDMLKATLPLLNRPEFRS